MITVEDIRNAYRTARERDLLAPSTLAMDESGYRAACDMGISDPTTFTLDNVDAFRRDRKLAGTSPRTMNIQVTALRRMLNWALERGMITENPLAKVKPLKDHGTYALRAFTVKEVRSLLRVTDPEWKPLFSLYLCTGMRRCEALWLEWNEYDSEEGIIKLPGGRTKTRMARTVYLGRRMLRVMNRIERVHDSVFLNPKTGQPYHEHSVRTALRRYAKRAGWHSLAGATTKAFRNTFITLALQKAKIKDQDVSKLAGHKTANLTTGLYYLPEIAYLRKETEKVERIILGVAAR